MPQLPRVDYSPKEGIRITLYKSVVPDNAMPRRRDFLVWGASSFLFVDPFQSLTRLSQLEILDSDSEGLDNIPLTENRYIYLYKDQDTNLFPEKTLDWIFQDFHDAPLLVITLVKADLQQIIAKFNSDNDTRLFYFDVYRTLGQDTGVIVFRSWTYSPVLNFR
ncbi:MAG: hypothetical protein HY867_03325 [Chloroflexi bacterium]|nr:hypothetical protein [Chloroflexota bacterium]